MPEIVGFRNLDREGGTIAKSLESQALDDHGRVDTPGLVALAVTGASYTDERIEQIADRLPEGQTLWAFSPHPRQAVGPRLTVTHVPAKHTREFVLKVSSHIGRVVAAQPVGAPLNPAVPAFPTARHEYASIDAFTLDASARHTATIDMDGLPFDFYFDPKPETGRLVVLGQDAIRRDRTPLPWFFRWKWSHLIDASVLIWSDPTLQLGAELDGAWWIGSRERDLAREGVQIVDQIAGTLGVAARDTLFVGMSAGGFSALQMAALLPESRALVDIPRVTLRAHGARGETANQAVRECLGFDDAASVPASHLPQIDVLARFDAAGRVPGFTYFQNLRDTSHLDSQYRPFREAIEAHPDYTPDHHVFREYSQWHLTKGGHFPIRRSSMVAEINAMLDRSPR